MSCDLTQLHRYHDGELDAPSAAAVEKHLLSCARCDEALASLKRMSAQLQSASRSEPGSEAVAAWTDAMKTAAEEDRGVLRIASWLSAAAAALLVVTMLSSNVDPRDVVQTAGVGEVIPLPLAPRDDAEPATLETAEWIAMDLAMAERTGPR